MAVTGVLVWPDGPGTSGTGSAWRLIVSAPDMPNGCQVRATNTTSGQTRLTPRDWNHEASYQMTDKGAWTWTADSPGCRVTEGRQPSPSSLLSVAMKKSPLVAR